MILIIDNYDSFTYNLYQVVAAQGVDVTVKRNDAISIDEIAALKPDGIIISPGPGRPEEAGIGIDVVKTFSATIPILGVCLGHQIITVAFGGNVGLAKQAIHGKGVLIHHDNSALYKKVSNPFQAARYHSLIAERTGLPDNLIVDAEGPDGIVMGIHHRDYNVFGVQFHPESILTPEGEQMIKNFIAICSTRDKK